MTGQTSWIETWEPDGTDRDLELAYAPVREPDGSICNLYKPYGLRPHILFAADQLFRATLHHPDNRLEPWLLELIGTHVARLTGCDYAFTHHGHNFRVLFKDDVRAAAILEALDSPAPPLDDSRLRAVLAYTGKLTLSPADLSEDDVTALRQTGLSDGEILEVNQVAASFSYWVRVINGLGITLGDEPVGFYPL